MSDLTNATRELFVRGVKNQVFMKTPLIDDLLERNKVIFSGGKYIERLVKYNELDSLAQSFSGYETLTNSAETTLDKPRFTWKKWQVPVQYEGDIEIQNANAGNEQQLLDLVENLVKDANRASTLYLNSLVFNSGSATPVSDSAKQFQSLVSALDHDNTYGTLTRLFSSNTRDWWQGSDPGALLENVSTSAQDTATGFTISNIRKWIWETNIAHNLETVGDIRIYVCPTLFNKLRAEMESKIIYKPADPQKQGFEKMVIDGFTVVSVPYLQRTSTTQTWVFIINLEDWELYLSSERNFKMTEFKWQGENANGSDYYLARILVAGNLVCWSPRGSLWLSNVS